MSINIVFAAMYVVTIRTRLCIVLHLGPHHVPLCPHLPPQAEWEWDDAVFEVAEHREEARCCLEVALVLDDAGDLKKNNTCNREVWKETTGRAAEEMHFGT